MRALKTKIRGLDKTQFKRLRELTAHAKNLYNQALWTLREAFSATGKYFSYSQMDKAMRQEVNLEGEVNYKLLKAKVAQQTLRRLDKNFFCFFRAIQDFKKNPSKYKGQPRPPRFKPKKHDNLIFNYQAFKIKYKLVVLGRGNHKGLPLLKSFKMPSGKVIKSAEVLVREAFVVLEKGLEIKRPKQLVGKTIKQVEVIPKYKSFHAVFTYDDEQTDIYQKVKPLKTTELVELDKLDSKGEFSSKIVTFHNKVMSIDLGLNNLATCVTNGIVKPFIIDGRRLKSVNAYYNKQKAKIQSTLEKTRRRKWSRKLQNLTNRRNAAVNDYMHRATHFVVKTCVENNISKVVVGDVTQSLNCINLGKKTNQNFVNLSLGQFIDQLDYKLGQHGIILEVANESYTSKASFVDDDKMPKRYPNVKKKHIFSGTRVKRGLYKAASGTLLNADVNGAFNILRKNDSDFSYEKLVEKVGKKFKDWLHPTKRIRFFNKQPQASARG
ncbi:MAG: transposase [Pseudomonadota bacterium]